MQGWATQRPANTATPLGDRGGKNLGLRSPSGALAARPAADAIFRLGNNLCYNFCILGKIKRVHLGRGGPLNKGSFPKRKMV